MDIRVKQRAVVEALEDIKGRDIVVFNVAHQSAYFERVVIASGDSGRQVNALATSVQDKLKALGLVVPNLENLRPWAAGKGHPFTDDASLIALPQCVDKIEREVKKCLRDLAHFEIPKKVLLVERDFSIETGELTPTLKVKRRVVEKNYAGIIEAAYADGSREQQ